MVPREQKLSNAPLAPLTPPPMAPVIRANSNQVEAKCKLCDVRGHRSSECTRYRRELERSMRCDQIGICTNCLKRGHTKLRCNAKPICAKCKQNGHVAVFCPVNFAAQNADEPIAIVEADEVSITPIKKKMAETQA